MNFIIEDYHRNTSDKELLDDVKNVAIRLKKDTVTIHEYDEHGKFHPSTLQRRFGSWFKMLELAELKPSRSKLNISNDELFDNLQKVWIALGRQPRYSEMKNPLSKYSSSTYDNRFGSWGKALVNFVEYINKENDIVDNYSIEDVSNSDTSQNIKHKTKREISDRLRFSILMRDSFTCKKCGKSPLKESGVELHVDHVIPWSKGGETIPENLETKCKQCNLGKGNEFYV
jgi:hypothetical protein